MVCVRQFTYTLSEYQLVTGDNSVATVESAAKYFNQNDGDGPQKVIDVVSHYDLFWPYGLFVVCLFL